MNRAYLNILIDNFVSMLCPSDIQLVNISSGGLVKSSWRAREELVKYSSRVREELVGCSWRVREEPVKPKRPGAKNKMGDIKSKGKLAPSVDVNLFPFDSLKRGFHVLLGFLNLTSFSRGNKNWFWLVSISLQFLSACCLATWLIASWVMRQLSEIT